MKGEATARRMTHAGSREKTNGLRNLVVMVGEDMWRGATAFSRKLVSEIILVGKESEKKKSTY